MVHQDLRELMQTAHELSAVADVVSQLRQRYQVFILSFLHFLLSLELLLVSFGFRCIILKQLTNRTIFIGILKPKINIITMNICVKQCI